MRLQQYLNEEYETRIRDHGHSFEVFVNPTIKEIREVTSDSSWSMLKFIADNRHKKLYVWKWVGPLHEPAWRQISGKDLNTDITTGNVMPGYARLKGSKLEMRETDAGGFFDDYIEDTTDIDAEKEKWKWLSKYMDTKRAFFMNEEYFGRFKGDYSGKKFTVFKNPTSKEIRETAEISGSIRFIADAKTKDIYIWNAMGGIHIDVWDEDRDVNKGRHYEDAVLDLEVLWGVCKIRGGKMVMTDSDNILAGYPPHDDLPQLKHNMKWLNRYIEIDRYFDIAIDRYRV
jgi:hypothetical protein